MAGTERYVGYDAEPRLHNEGLRRAHGTRRAAPRASSCSVTGPPSSGGPDADTNPVSSRHLALHDTNPNPLVEGPTFVLASFFGKVRRRPPVDRCGQR